jgi:hypothetical protein
MARPVQSVQAMGPDDVAAAVRDEEPVDLDGGCQCGRDPVRVARKGGELLSIGLGDDRRDARPVRLDRRAHRDAAPKQEGQLTEPGPVGGHPRQAVEFVSAHPAQRAMIVGMQRAAGLSDAVGTQHHRLGQRHIDADARTDRHVDAEFLEQFAGQRGPVALPRRHLSTRQLPHAGQLRRPCPLRHQQQGTRDQRTRNDDLVRHCPRRSLARALSAWEQAAAVQA